MISISAAVSEQGLCKTLFYTPENMSIECCTDVASAEGNAFGHFGRFLHPTGVKGMDQQEEVSAYPLMSFFC
jgi:hypothetical protein